MRWGRLVEHSFSSRHRVFTLRCPNKISSSILSREILTRNCPALLKVALITVKKRWEAIYECVAIVEPRFFLPTVVREGRRGAEKRRRVFAFLRQHPEELRPGLPV